MFKEKQCENNGKGKKANLRDCYNQNHIHWLSRFMSLYIVPLSTSRKQEI